MILLSFHLTLSFLPKLVVTTAFDRYTGIRSGTREGDLSSEEQTIKVKLRKSVTIDFRVYLTEVTTPEGSYVLLSRMRRV